MAALLVGSRRGMVSDSISAGNVGRNSMVSEVYGVVHGPYPERVTEKDPNGIPSKQPGSKLDYGKIPVTQGCLHYFPRVLRELARLSQIGAKKYSWKGWKSVPDGIHRYGDALGRHELSIEDNFHRRDPDTGMLEVIAVAWNACARAELVLREMEK